MADKVGSINMGPPRRVLALNGAGRLFIAWSRPRSLPAAPCAAPLKLESCTVTGVEQRAEAVAEGPRSMAASQPTCSVRGGLRRFQAGLHRARLVGPQIGKVGLRLHALRVHHRPATGIQLLDPAQNHLSGDGSPGSRRPGRRYRRLWRGRLNQQRSPRGGRGRGGAQSLGVQCDSPSRTSVSRLPCASVARCSELTRCAVRLFSARRAGGGGAPATTPVTSRPTATSNPRGNVRHQRFIDIWKHSPRLAQVRSIRARDLPVCSTCGHVSD
jgi:hypothetical protein